MIKKWQTKHIFWYKLLNFKKQFSNNGNKKLQEKWNIFLVNVDIPKLSENQGKLWDGDLTEKGLYNSLKSMENDKSPSKDGWRY